MGWQAAIFDWNGTLFDDVQIAYKGVCKIFQTFGLPLPTLEDYRNHVTPDIVSFYHARGVPVNVTLGDLNKIFKPVIEEHWEEPKLAPHVDLVLAQCNQLGIKKAIVSAEKPDILQKRLVQFRLEDQFDEVRSAAYDKNLVLVETLVKLGVYPKQAFYVDDTVGGIEAAKSVRLKTIGYIRGYNSKAQIEKAAPDVLVDSFWDIMEIVNSEL